MQVDFKKEFIKLRGESRPMNRKIMDRARALNLPLFSRILKKGRSQLGCSSPRPLDDVESKDMMMCTLLFGALGLKYNHIIQIGGNFGNLPRLIEGIVDYSKWTIVDDPNKIKIQKWFLEQELKINFNREGLGITLGRSFLKNIDITFYRYENKITTTPANCTTN